MITLNFVRDDKVEFRGRLSRDVLVQWQRRRNSSVVGIERMSGTWPAFTS